MRLVVLALDDGMSGAQVGVIRPAAPAGRVHQVGIVQKNLQIDREPGAALPGARAGAQVYRERSIDDDVNLLIYIIKASTPGPFLRPFACASKSTSARQGEASSP